MKDFDIKIIESAIEYHFNNVQFLEQAFTHSSYANEHNLKSYERLEFLGDAAVDYIIANELCKEFPTKAEGELTKLRARIVSNKAQNEYFEKLGLTSFIRMGGKQNCTPNASVVADVFEAIIGAICMDADSLEPAIPYVNKVLKSAKLAALNSDNVVDYKTRVLEICAKQGKKAVFSVLSSEKDEQPYFKVALIIDGKKVSVGEGGRKKEAEQNASKQFLA